MKYFSALTSLILLNIFAIVALLYFGTTSRFIEEENDKILAEIAKQQEQLKINEVEYSLYKNYNYLLKLQKLYFSENKVNLKGNNRLTLKNLDNSKIPSVFVVNSE
tara:strand:- start:189 stop:506 length:318 start_codon:yes stop_codon:yes gene_type:complete